MRSKSFCLVLIVNMGGEYKLVLATHYFFCNLHSDFMAFFGGYLPRIRSIHLS